MLLLVLEGVDEWRCWGRWVHAIVPELWQCDLMDAINGQRVFTIIIRTFHDLTYAFSSRCNCQNGQALV